MRAARDAVVACVRRGEWPTTSEIVAMLAEVGTDPIEEHRLGATYAAARPDAPSGEARVLAELRDYSMRWPIHH